MQTFTGIQYLKMDIASSFGMDKATWNDRLAWFEENEHQLDNITKQAKEPAQFLAGVMAFKKAIAGVPTGYICGLDATASGIQLLSVLAGCVTSARACNLVNTGKREDTYTSCYQFMNHVMGTDGKIPRNDIKDALMTHMYGSKAVPIRVFGEDTPELECFYEVVDVLLPGANLLNYDLLGLWNPEAMAHSWIMPDGFEVKVKVMQTVTHEVKFLGGTYPVYERVNQPMETGLSIGANIVHSVDGMVVREMNRRCNFDVSTINHIEDLLDSDQLYKQSTIRAKDLALLQLLSLIDLSNFMSAVILSYVDKHNIGHLDQTNRTRLHMLLDSMPDTSFPIICIHD